MPENLLDEMLGELKDLLAMELTGKDGGPIETVDTSA